MGLAMSCIRLSVVISSLSAMCHVARCVHPSGFHWTPGRGSHGWGNLELWRIAAHKFERNVFGLHRPAIPASAPLRPLPHRSWWGHRPGSWKKWNILQHPPPGIRTTQKRRLDTREAVPVASHLYLVLPFQLVRGRLNEETRIGTLTLSTSLS